jgi:CheY-like chemotaxis protein
MKTEQEVVILLVEDDPVDAELTMESLKEAKMCVNLRVVGDGEKALKCLRGEAPYAEAERPDLVLLDLNMPKMDGREVLSAIKGDERLRSIPVVVLTTSGEEMDVMKCYSLGANCYITKPVGFEKFIQMVRSLEDFWLSVVKLPTRASGGRA